MSLSIAGFHHVALITSDYVRAKHFYTEVLEAQIIEETWREARQSYKLDLQLPGGARLELFSFPSPPPRPSYPEACGLRHLALSVTDLDSAVSMLKSRGVTCEAIRTDELTHQRFTFFADPDGTPIEFYELR
ncbi:SMU1112c/YaeR family gloxylase I-like metalloprotein [Phytohalomonas tamaricis]|uniref:SMU1112c/YaeR family gloxylase I-like metalloprotein n=1 Tax=Phytohalomonas tamaricis TaxID=2081032 RepID=UPI000D0BA9E1|nr:VOC family protein [Phytohalomonas tamaricis]